RIRRVAAPSYGELFQAMEAVIADGAAETSHLGLGIAPGDEGEPSAVVVLARRLVSVEPFPSTPGPGDSVTVRGRLSAAASDSVFWLGMEQGRVRPLEARVDGRDFELTAGPLPPGLHFFEIMVEAGEGPEVALLAPLRVGPGDLAGAPLPDIGSPRDLPAWQAAVHQAVADHRRFRGLSAAARDGRLDDLAKERAEASAGRGRPVHRPGPDEDAAARLAEEGYAFAWAAENLATGPGPADALLGILESPAHRRLLEDPKAARLGVGLHVEEGRTWLAIILAEPMSPPAAVPFATATRVVQDRLLHRAEQALRAARRGRGLPVMLRDPALDSLAGALAGHLAERDLPSDRGAQEQARSHALASDPLAAGVSLEVVVGGRPEDLVRAPSLVEDDCERLGLGVARARSRRFGGERLWLTAICLHRKERG
ncbi:MAG: CAP domain-containing protein, partial [Myxococcota bacterium]